MRTQKHCPLFVICLVFVALISQGCDKRKDGSSAVTSANSAAPSQSSTSANAVRVPATKPDPTVEVTLPKTEFHLPENVLPTSDATVSLYNPKKPDDVARTIRFYHAGPSAPDPQGLFHRPLFSLDAAPKIAGICDGTAKVTPPDADGTRVVFFHFRLSFPEFRSMCEAQLGRTRKVYPWPVTQAIALLKRRSFAETYISAAQTPILPAADEVLELPMRFSPHEFAMFCEGIKANDLYFDWRVQRTTKDTQNGEIDVEGFKSIIDSLAGVIDLTPAQKEGRAPIFQYQRAAIIQEASMEIRRRAKGNSKELVLQLLSSDISKPLFDDWNKENSLTVSKLYEEFKPEHEKLAGYLTPLVKDVVEKNATASSNSAEKTDADKRSVSGSVTASIPIKMVTVGITGSASDEDTVTKKITEQSGVTWSKDDTNHVFVPSAVRVSRYKGDHVTNSFKSSTSVVIDIGEKSLWEPEGDVPYTFTTGTAQANVAYQSAMRDWKEKVKKFKERNDEITACGVPAGKWDTWHDRDKKVRDSLVFHELKSGRFNDHGREDTSAFNDEDHRSPFKHIVKIQGWGTVLVNHLVIQTSDGRQGDFGKTNGQDKPATWASNGTTHVQRLRFFVDHQVRHLTVIATDGSKVEMGEADPRNYSNLPVVDLGGDGLEVVDTKVDRGDDHINKVGGWTRALDTGFDTDTDAKKYIDMPARPVVPDKLPDPGPEPTIQSIYAISERVSELEVRIGAIEARSAPTSTAPAAPK